ncbi:hypothetical protein [Planosporangium mesophilum]|uniref:Uncharacterized protein n=1 Tax=Planosporangium mesophilum TaxID=689768 RepID=A0A8J3TDX9_9ACTN|nr:hypothetical protein [Planosporangium mesophilum]NJC84198.1 hypothetical protein [Planosporangium mesophilum]GII23039.1 hypothetical protein Pme01_26360 [Planosporangium mesophilum]
MRSPEGTGKVRMVGVPHLAPIWFLVDARGERSAVEGEMVCRLRMEHVSGALDIAL